jgi:ring-1,2-phenylacetyl-CoA epoxidase subunit PaaC
MPPVRPEPVEGSVAAEGASIGSPQAVGHAGSAVAGAGGSIHLRLTPAVRYVLRIADTALIHAQRLAEWCGHAPVLEEDIALSNLALDSLGQARALLTHAATLEGQGFDEDALAFLREEHQFLNLTLVELPLRKPSAHSPGGDFADTQLRNLFVAAWMKALYTALQRSSDAMLAAIAGKALKEVRYHQQHAAGWVLRLGDGTEESARRLQAALQRAWPYTAELFVADEVDAAAAAAGLGPSRAELREPWQAEVLGVLAEAGVVPPAATPFLSTGSLGRHSEHLGYILAELQYLQRRYPGGVW